MDTLLRAAWHDCLGGHPEAAGALDELVGRYREPHRHYHGVAHLRAVVRDVGILLPSVELVTHPALVRLAAFFHDAVYDPRSAGNEAASAVLGRRTLGDLGLVPSALDEVERLIMTTVDHTSADGGAAVLSDADLAVLGAEPSAYQAYAIGVRAEYGFVEDSAWRVGRAAVLDRFLARPLIYRTPTMSRHESRARANLTAERRSLDG